MSRRLSSKPKRINLYHSNKRFLLPALFTLLVGGVGAYLIFLSSAASFGGGGHNVIPYTVTRVPNPGINQTCTGGLNIALVADVSESINAASLQEMKDAFNNLISTLLPGPAMLSVSEFASAGSISQPFTSNITALNRSINQLGNNISRNGTDWQAGLESGLNTFSGLSPSTPRLLIIATDGDPYPGTTANMNAAVAEANAIKNAGIHVLVIGLGSSPTTTNLEGLSGDNLSQDGTNVSINTDVITTDFTTLGPTLAHVISGGCPAGNGGVGDGGTGGGTGGTGPGADGNGPGQDGSGPGTGDSGTSDGATTGTSSGTQTSSNPTPTPTPSDDPTTQTVDTPTPNPTPQQAPASSPTQTTQPTPQPAPKPTAQGTQTPPPTETPSPFYDGKQYAAGSAPDNLASVIKPRTNRVWLYIAFGVVLLLGVGGFLAWQKRAMIPVLAKKSGKQQPKKQSPKR